MDSRNYLQDPRLNPTSKHKLTEFGTMIQASYAPTVRISQLYDLASRRPGNKDPFLTWWKVVSDVQTQLALEVQAAVSKFKGLEAQLDGSVGKVEDWKEQFDVAVDAMSRWASEQQKILDMDQVKKFVAQEEALVAAGAV